MPKRSIYIPDTDVAVWEQAEALAVHESFSSVLTQALKSWIQGRRGVIAAVRLVNAKDAICVRVEPSSSGWLMNVPKVPVAGQTAPVYIEAELQNSGVVLPGEIKFDWPDNEECWIWVPPANIISLRFLTPRYVGGVDYQQAARSAWSILIHAVKKNTLLSYGDVGDKLGGLNPHTQVPKVLDSIERWCLDNNRSDLTAWVINKESGLPGPGYWKAHAAQDLPVPKQVALWEKDRKEATQAAWPNNAPF